MFAEAIETETTLVKGQECLWTETKKGGVNWKHCLKHSGSTVTVVVENVLFGKGLFAFGLKGFNSGCLHSGKTCHCISLVFTKARFEFLFMCYLYQPHLYRRNTVR